MSRFEKAMLRLLTGTSDANFAFDDLRHILLRLGFVERVRGSHHTFRRAGVEHHLVLQPDGKDAKPYQVRQVRNAIIEHQLGGLDEQ